MVDGGDCPISFLFGARSLLAAPFPTPVPGSPLGRHSQVQGTAGWFELFLFVHPRTTCLEGPI